MKHILASIIAKKRPVFFISPHLDDAALSCGGLIQHLSDKTSVTIVNVFTKADNSRPTLSARKSVHDSGFTEAIMYYDERNKEDARAYATMSVKVVALGETDALWRKKTHQSWFLKQLGRVLPEVNHVYPTYRLHIASGKVSQQDTVLINRITTKLKRLIPKNAVVFAPIGIGNHVDHLVTTYATEKSFKPLYWTDQPYFIRESIMEKNKENKLRLVEFKANQPQKKAFLSHYKTQMHLLFAGKPIPVIREFFLIPR